MDAAISLRSILATTLPAAAAIAVFGTLSLEPQHVGAAACHRVERGVQEIVAKPPQRDAPDGSRHCRTGCRTTPVTADHCR